MSYFDQLMKQAKANDTKKLGGRSNSVASPVSGKSSQSSDNFSLLMKQARKNDNRRIAGTQFGFGNIDLTSRPSFRNADGSISTVDSASYNLDGKEVLLPTVWVKDGKAYHSDSDDEIVQRYKETGEYLGKFDTPELANEYAQALHEAQAEQYTTKKRGSRANTTAPTTSTASAAAPAVDTAAKKQQLAELKAQLAAEKAKLAPDRVSTTPSGRKRKVSSDRAHRLGGDATKRRELESQIRATEQELAEAEKTEKANEFYSVWADPDFQQTASKGSAKKGNVVVNSRAHKNPRGHRGRAGKDSHVVDVAFSNMTEDEVKTYNYLYETDEKKAKEYLAFIREDLNARQGEKEGKLVRENTDAYGRVAGTVAYGVGAGLDQFGGGVAQFLSSERRPTSATQFGSAYIREDLKDSGPQLPDWLGGASVGQAAYDAVTTTANMAPSILLSALTAGAGAPAAAAQAAGTAAMGVGAAGNAYGQALAEGRSKTEARLYSTLIGASEAGLQSVLGGIGAFGGSLAHLPKVATLVNNIDNSLLRISTNLGVKMLSEGGEEYLQEILDPVFRNMIYGENNDVALWTPDATYSFLLGALTAGLLDGAGSVRSDIQINRDGAQIKGAKYDSALIDAALKLDPETEAYSTAKQIKNGTLKNTTHNVGELFYQYARAEGDMSIFAAPATEKAEAQSTERLDAVTTALMGIDMGSGQHMNLKTAKQKADIIQRCLNGEVITPADVNKLNLTQAPVRELFEQFLGGTLPTDYNKLSATEQVAAVQRLAKAARGDTNATAETALPATQEATEGNFTPTPEMPAQAVQEGAQMALSAAPVAEAQGAIPYEEFAKIAKEMDPDLSDPVIQQAYEDYAAGGDGSAVEVIVLPGTNRRMTFDEFKTFMHVAAERSGQQPFSDAVLREMFDEKLAEQGVDSAQRAAYNKGQDTSTIVGERNDGGKEEGRLGSRGEENPNGHAGPQEENGIRSGVPGEIGETQERVRQGAEELRERQQAVQPGAEATVEQTRDAERGGKTNGREGNEQHPDRAAEAGGRGEGIHGEEQVGAVGDDRGQGRSGSLRSAESSSQEQKRVSNRNTAESWDSAFFMMESDAGPLSFADPPHLSDGEMSLGYAKKGKWVEVRSYPLTADGLAAFNADLSKSDGLFAPVEQKASAAPEETAFQKELADRRKEAAAKAKELHERKLPTTEQSVKLSNGRELQYADVEAKKVSTRVEKAARDAERVGYKLRCAVGDLTDLEGRSIDGLTTDTDILARVDSSLTDGGDIADHEVWHAYVKSDWRLHFRAIDVIEQEGKGDIFRKLCDEAERRWGESYADSDPYVHRFLIESEVLAEARAKNPSLGEEMHELFGIVDSVTSEWEQAWDAEGHGQIEHRDPDSVELAAEYAERDGAEFELGDDSTAYDNPNARYRTAEGNDRIFYTPRGVEVIQNPTSTEYRQMREEAYADYPQLRGTDEPVLRHTYDEDGNEYYWRADRGMHAQVEPYINRQYQTRTSQQWEWWTRPDKDEYPQDYSGVHYRTSENTSAQENRQTVDDFIRRFNEEHGEGAAEQLYQTVQELQRAKARVERKLDAQRESQQAERSLNEQAQRDNATAWLIYHKKTLRTVQREYRAKLDEAHRAKAEAVKNAVAETQAVERATADLRVEQQKTRDAQKLESTVLTERMNAKKQAAKRLRVKEDAYTGEKLERRDNDKLRRNAAKNLLRDNRRVAERRAIIETEQGPIDTIRKNPKERTAIERVQGAADSLRTLGRSAYRAFVNQATDIDRFAKRQQSGTLASTLVNIVGGASTTTETIYKRGLVDRAGNRIGESMSDVFLCWDEKGKNVDENKQALLQDYMLHKHNIDRMSFVEKARTALESYEAKNPWLAEMDAKELAKLTAMTDAEVKKLGKQEAREAAKQYAKLLNDYSEARDKPVFPDQKGNPITAATSREVVAKYEADNPWLAEKAEGIYRWWDRFMRTWVVGDSLSEADYETMREMYPHYVPTYRADKKALGAGNFVGMGGASVGSVVKKAKGSLSEIVNIEDSFANLANKAVRVARTNELYKNMVDTAMLDGEGLFSDMAVFDWDSTRLGRAYYAADGTEVRLDSSEARKAEAADALERAEQAGLVKTKDGYRLSAWYDGELLSAFVSEDLFKSIQNTTGSSANDLEKGLLKIGNALTGPMKTAITGINPNFAARNITRDLPTAIVNSISGMAFPKYYAQALSEMLKGSERWQQYQALGGTNATYYNDQQGFAKTMSQGDSLGSKITGKLGAFNEFSEAQTRFAEYLATIDRLGDTYENRLLGIKNSAEVTVDFSRKGRYGKVINAWVPYWNPAVQGIDKVFRSVVQSPDGSAVWKQATKTLGRAAMTTVLFEALLYAWLKSHDDYDEWEELSDRVKDTYYCIPTSDHKFLKIPKNREWGAILGTPLMRLLESANGRDDPFENYVETSLAPNFLPGAILGFNGERLESDVIGVSQALDLAYNEDFAGRTIVPYVYQQGSLTEQYDAETSVFSRKLGELLNFSPMQLDYLLEDYFGDFGDLFTMATAEATWTGEASVAEDVKKLFTSPWLADNRYSNQTVSDYYETLTDLEKRVQDKRNQLGDEAQDTVEYKTQKAMEKLYGKEIKELNRSVRDMPDGEEKDQIKARVALLAGNALDFYEQAMNGSIAEPALTAEYAALPTVLSDELIRLDGLSGDYSFTPGNYTPSKYNDPRKKGYEYVLDDEQKDKYKELYRETYAKTMSEVIRKDKYRKGSDTKKAEMLEAARDDVTEETKDAFLDWLRANYRSTKKTK